MAIINDVLGKIVESPISADMGDDASMLKRWPMVCWVVSSISTGMDD